MSAAAERLAAMGQIAEALAAKLSCVVPCRPPDSVQALDVRIRYQADDGDAVNLALVTVEPADGGTPIDSKRTDSSGDAIFLLPVGRYRVTARKDFHLPRPAVEARVDVEACGFPIAMLCLEELNFHLHVDADRDGRVDDDRSGLDSWTWGVDGKGAIILANNDDDGLRDIPDNDDDVVNADPDSDDIAAFEIRREGSALNPPPAWKAVLSLGGGVDEFVRVFDSRAPGALEVIGPTTGNSYELPDLNFDTREFGIEAVQYADSLWDGLVTLILTLTRDGRGRRERAQFRVAPWMMPNHLDPASEVFVVDNGNANLRYRFDLEYGIEQAGCSLNEFSNRDVWMQDCMEIGYSNLPGQGMHSVMRNPRDRPLQIYAKKLLNPDFGYHEQGSMAGDNTFDSTGNLECTPPVENFPWGRIYYGPGRPMETMDAEVQEFLKKQLVQKPIEIDTGFLAVGHVDEIISFVPAPDRKGFRLLLASPRKAYDILNANKAAHGNARMLIGRQFGLRSAEVSIQDFLDKGVLGFPALRLRIFNLLALRHILKARRKFKAELGLDDEDIIEIPGLFMPNDDSPAFADALTAGMVNMLVLNQHCIVPKPFGPVVAGKDLFEEDVKTSLTPLGLTIRFLDDWDEYHVNLGEVHCSTNTLRTPVQANWWEFEP
jgi:protein-arginine deiminase